MLKQRNGDAFSINVPTTPASSFSFKTQCQSSSQVLRLFLKAKSGVGADLIFCSKIFPRSGATAEKPPLDPTCRNSLAEGIDSRPLLPAQISQNYYLRGSVLAIRYFPVAVDQTFTSLYGNLVYSSM